MSLSLQIITLICGFIVPRLILQQYGSSVNGLVQSITQFLSIISFLELGVGTVIQSSLYKPLAEDNKNAISAIISSGEKFFRRIALILLVYVIILTATYPLIVQSEFDWLYSALLIVAISISSFARYYCGIVDRLLLTADQRGYIQYTSQIITLVLNTIACYFLIKIGASIQVVKLTTSIIYLVRPLVLRVYVNKRYSINRRIKYEGEPIKQKWNGVAQHVAAVVLDNTDIIVLTSLSSLANVSIYSVYNMVVYGIKTLFTSVTNGIQSLMGEMIAKDKKDQLRLFFHGVEFSIHTVVVYLFSCTAILIIPFVQVYTKGITDVNYTQPIFAILLVSAHACHCLRLPYNIAILASGHYKQTQSNYIIAAIINITISIVTVKIWGLIGVAIGTLIAMIYQTIWMAVYDSKHILNWPITSFIKQCMFDVALATLIYFCTSWLQIHELTYFAWLIYALETAIIAAIIVIVMSILCYKKTLLEAINYLGKRNK